MFPGRWSGVGISAIVAVLWVWLGVAYHLVFFTSINPLAYGFGALSTLGRLFFLAGYISQEIRIQLAMNVRSVIGTLTIVFALAIYPVWSVYAGHSYPELPTFDLPCPTTIFTIGLLVLAVRPYPRSPLVVPVIWSFIGGQAAFLLGIPSGPWSPCRGDSGSCGNSTGEIWRNRTLEGYPIQGRARGGKIYYQTNGCASMPRLAAWLS
jgi:hypothetical protein